MKVSIITINKNNAIGLEQTILSTINQDRNLYEYIIVDGNSSDASLSIIEKYKDKIDFYISEPDEGIYSAMNKGARMANGKYLFFLNSGDVFYDSHVLADILKHDYDQDFILGGICVFYKKRHLKIYYPKKIRFYDILEGVSHQSTFTQKKIFDKMNGYDETIKITSDWAFLMNAIYSKRCSIATCKRLVTFYNIEGISSQVSSKKIIEKEKENMLKQLNIKFNKFFFSIYRFRPRIFKVRLFYKISQRCN
jgi:Glycosyltransferases involved in cell wall biogenesis